MGETGRVDRKEGGNRVGVISTHLKGVVGEMGRVDKRRGGAMGIGISQMECLGKHTFPEQCRVTQLVPFIYAFIVLFTSLLKL